MYADVQRKCSKCGQAFWLTAAEQTLCHALKRAAPDRCPACRTTAASGELSSALATFEQIRAGDNTAVGHVLPDPSVMFKDIQQLLGIACSPIQYRSRTFWEWIRGIDLEDAQVQQKLRAGEHADRLLQQRLALIRHFQEVARAMQEAEDAQIARRQKMLQAYLEELKLEEAIAQQQALREQRIKTQQLEETRKQVHLLNEINPPPPVEPVDPMKEAIDTHRSQLRAKATAKQLVLCDCIKAVHEIYHSADFEAAEKAAQIRLVTEAYNQELDVLPKEVREFVASVESGEYDAGKESDDDGAEDEENDEEDEDQEDEWDSEDEDEEY